MIGRRLGTYQVEALLGAGGMGEVYRARDTTLGREVAIKILPQAFAADPERLARFEREARALASFSHPNIGAIYGIEDSTDDEGLRHRALVLELVEGETLAERLARGPLSIDQTLHVSAQIADALDAAHEKGIVHRDLKPANIKITPGGVVKVLDFGLAKIVVSAGEASHLSTIVSDATRTGTVLGTAAYMSPEQARGLAVDKRTDIWAFGCVLYEMLAGRAAFGGPTITDTLAAVLEHQPDWNALPKDTPSRCRELLAACLVKDPKGRLRDIGDASHSLQPSGPPDVPDARPPLRPWSAGTRVALAAAAVLIVAAAAAIGWALRRPAGGAAPPAQIRLSLPPPAGFLFSQDVERLAFALSPDGTQLAFVTNDRGATRVWLRRLSAAAAQPMAGTDGARSLFWSPDSTAIAFFAGDKLKRIDVSGGVPVSICDVPAGIGLYGSWGTSSEIVYASVEGDAVYRVPVAGGAPVAAVARDRSRGESRVNWPWFLPDGKRFVFITRLQDGSGQLTVAGDDRPPRRIAPLHSVVQWVEPGYLVFAREGTLLAQRFDAAAERLVGEPIPIADPVEHLYQTAKAGFTTSRNGVLAYRPELDVDRLVWYDRAGNEIGSIGAPAGYQSVSISRDGRAVAIDRVDPRFGAGDLWVFDVERKVETRLTSAPSAESWPEWMAGGRALVFMAATSGPPHLFRRDMTSGETVELTPVSALQQPTDVTSDDMTLAFMQRTARGNFDIWTLSLSGPAAPTAILSSPFNEIDFTFSPDGSAAAWISDESGRPELYVAPRASIGSRIRVSTDGARHPVWSRPAGELFYLTPDGRVMTVPIRTAPQLSIGTPAPLFTVKGKNWQTFDVAPDGRFLAVVPQIAAGEQPLTVVLNWNADLPR